MMDQEVSDKFRMLAGRKLGAPHGREASVDLTLNSTHELHQVRDASGVGGRVIFACRMASTYPARPIQGIISRCDCI
jgi:hypothetical protein